VAFSPEREDPSNPNFDCTTIPKVVGGLDEASLDAAKALYGAVTVRVVPVSSPAAAEAAKLLENIFRAVNIALVNEMKMVLDKMGIDVWEVIEAAATKPFGFMPFYPGPGLGGHCIPIDPFYLTWKAREVGIATRFIELAGEINSQMPDYVVGRLAQALNDHSKSIRGSRVLILGVAYKKNVEDLRESASLRLIRLLRTAGASVDYHDPHVPEIMKTREYPEFAGMKSVPLSEIGNYDAAIIATAHDRVDYGFVASNARLVVDTRNAIRDRNYKHVYRA
jgi:UDP-N-acetyl-D-glucosamine dehydrogenase